MMLAEAESLLSRRLLPEALIAFDRAEGKGEDFASCSAGRWQSHMLMGDFESAWRESDAIRARNTPDPHRFWNGEDIAGKRIILRCLHGLGDSVQFLRYVPLLTARGSHVTVQVAPALFELASHFQGVTDVVTWKSPDNPEPAWDLELEINELPYIFRTRLVDLPIATNYLTLSPDILEANRLRPRNLASHRIGLVWSCGAWNPSRNIPFDLLSTVLEYPGCEFWNLQGGQPRADCNVAAVHRADVCATSLLNLAALIAQLDLILTPDTLAAHLAGALGTPAFVLLKHASDWRWLHARRDSPWYPSLRLFRQPCPDDWLSVIELVCAALTRFAEPKLVA